MSINWKLRLKNKATLIALVSAVMVFATSVAQALGFELPVTTAQVVDAAAAVLTVLAALGIVVDPTTSGVGDSSLAMLYEEPRKTGDSIAMIVEENGIRQYIAEEVE